MDYAQTILKSMKERHEVLKHIESNPPLLTREEFKAQVARLQAWSDEQSLVRESSSATKSKD